MKKILLLVLAVMLVLGLAVSAFADAVYTGSVDARVKIHPYKYATAGLSVVSTTITAGNRILGYAYTDSAAGSVAIFDTTTIALADAGSTYLISELSVSAGTVQTMMFPFPKTIENGFVSRPSTATGCITVYYQ